jgi:hypothetical protein
MATRWARGGGEKKEGLVNSVRGNLPEEKTPGVSLSYVSSELLQCSAPSLTHLRADLSGPTTTDQPHGACGVCGVVAGPQSWSR